MNKHTLEQLKKVRITLPSFNEYTTHMIIDSSTAPTQLTLEVGKRYVLQLADYVVNEPPGFTLSKDWNYGKHPMGHSFNGRVREIRGNMIYVDGATHGLEMYENTLFRGWLPRKAITIEAEVSE